MYDLVEAVFENSDWDDRDASAAQKYINHVLEQEGSAYRVIDGIVTPIISEHEIEALEKTTELTDKFSVAGLHIGQAIKHLSDRRAPDYRNSIKESISAVEATCRILTGSRTATLGEALKLLEKNGLVLHGAFKDGINRLYGYTSDEQGIRHSLLDETNIGFADAKFMAVACSAFVNLLIEKVRPAK